MREPAESVPGSVAEALAGARAQLAAGRLAEADAACQALLAAHGDLPPALHLRALVAARAGDLARGIGLLRQVVALDPASLPARNDLGAMLITAGDPVAAEAELAAAVGLVPASADARVNLANALHAQGRLDAAEAGYREALALDPRHVRGLVSLGNLLAQLRRPAEAHEHLVAAAVLAPGVAAVHQFLGNAQRDLGRIEEAVASYRRAIALEPGIADANESLGFILKAEGRYDEAIAHFRASGKPQARAAALECELRAGRADACFAYLQDRAPAEATNLHSASLSAYAAWHLGRPDPHPFCPDPLGRVRIVDRYTAPGDAAFLAELIREAGQAEAVWEPRGVTTKQGFQTGGNLFRHGWPALARLADDLLAALADYRAALPAGIGIADHWPATPRLHGWYVRLLTGGHQYFHNHPFGWMSGCLYLRMPTAAAPGEGAIEFGLESGDYPRLSSRPSPTRLHLPRPGQLALFPSSLYHRTVPFHSAEERHCIAFDLLPA